ncbi:twin-arginine translocase TatA/TatE family subunit [Glacieibacterium sp.]|uniref:twin-arginine translocase TatA/TatE family subunit n=1 Tax=Glacieibacterium sp. TaxID=2860237 RepID=UPI003B002C77
MGSFSLFHWLVVILVIMLLFGRGKISDLMGDMAKGINSFKKGLADDPVTTTHTSTAPPQIAPVQVAPVQGGQPVVHPSPAETPRS